MSSDALVERVARAIAAEHAGMKPGDIAGPMWKRRVVVAQAAIEASGLTQLKAENARLRSALDHDEADSAGRAAYYAWVKSGPCGDEEPDWGRDGYKVQSAMWQAVAHNVFRSILRARAALARQDG